MARAKIIEWEAHKPWPEKILFEGEEYSNSAYAAAHGGCWRSTASGNVIYFKSESGKTFSAYLSKLREWLRAEDESLPGNKLRKIRVERGLSQKQLADKVGCVQQVIHRYEKNEVEPRATMLKRLADALECKMEDLV